MGEGPPKPNEEEIKSKKEGICPKCGAKLSSRNETGECWSHSYKPNEVIERETELHTKMPKPDSDKFQDFTKGKRKQPKPTSND